MALVLDLLGEIVYYNMKNEGEIKMVKFEDIITIIKKDDGLAKLVKNATVGEKLIDLGFDSLDIMMLRHYLEVEYDVNIEITKSSDFEDVINKLNDLLVLTE